MLHRVRVRQARNRRAFAPGTPRSLFLLTLAAIVVLLGATGRAQTDGRPHLRVVERWLRVLLEHAVEQSETMRDLVTRIEAAPALVFVQCDPSLSASLSARLGLINRVDELRYVQIAIRCTLPDQLLMPTLAHEFQHALEIGERPYIVDVASMTAFYESAGFESSRNGMHRAFETAEARAVQQRVAEELKRAGSPGHTVGAP